LMQHSDSGCSQRYAPRLLERVDAHTAIYHGRWHASGWAAALLAPRDAVLMRTWRCATLAIYPKLAFLHTIRLLAPPCWAAQRGTRMCLKNPHCVFCEISENAMNIHFPRWAVITALAAHLSLLEP